MNPGKGIARGAKRTALASRVIPSRAEPESDVPLDEFIAECSALAQRQGSTADIVAAVAPRMRDLLGVAQNFLRPAHRRSDPAHYARNLVHAAPDASLSLFALVWEPGQWTPVHDHGTWGVVGVVEGLLVEQGYMRTDANAHQARDHGIQLVRGGLVLLAPGAVSTFVPNPDHIHMTGVPANEARTVSLHLYGRMLSSFHVYDLAAGTRSLFDAPHSES